MREVEDEGGSYVIVADVFDTVVAMKVVDGKNGSQIKMADISYHGCLDGSSSLS